MEPIAWDAAADVQWPRLRSAGCVRVSRGPGWGEERRGLDHELILTFPFLPASSFDNSHLCSGGGDKTVVLWDVATGQVVRKFRGHAGVSTSQTTLINASTWRSILVRRWFKEDRSIAVFRLCPSLTPRQSPSTVFQFLQNLSPPCPVACALALNLH